MRIKTIYYDRNFLYTFYKNKYLKIVFHNNNPIKNADKYYVKEELKRERRNYDDSVQVYYIKNRIIKDKNKIKIR